MRDNFYSLPTNLPIPSDDGACDHLEGQSLPKIELKTTSNRNVRLDQITQEPTVLFFYPRTGRPDEPSPVGWDEIAGARGCTPQSCGYRDLYKEFRTLGVQVFGVSTQTTAFQQELVSRINLPFEILSDVDFALTDALRLPTFQFSEMRLLKRMAWFCEGGKIMKVFYPVFPPDQNAETVLDWLKSRSHKEMKNSNIKKAESHAELEAIYPVMRELRPHLTFTEYMSLIEESQKRDDYEIVAAFDGNKCVAAMGFRILYDFVHGKHLYIDDLVVTASCRSKGVGAEFLEYAERVANEKQCKGLRLCTGIDRKDSQRFYERNNWNARAIAYKKQLKANL